jgi:hypothetical protein
MKVLINLIGGQPAPNYIAAKEIQPDKIFNIYSDASELIMNRLNELLKIDIITPPLKVNAYDFEEIFKALNEFLAGNLNEIIVNVTGGTKLMSIAAFEVAKNFNLKSVYVDSENHYLYSFHNDKIESKKLQKKISIENYFYLHGFKNVKENIVEYSLDLNVEIEKFNEFLFNNPESVKKILNLTIEIIKYKRRSKKNWLKETVRINKNNNYFDWNNGKGIIHYNIKDREFEFKFKDDTFIDYHNGKWFEKLVYDKLKSSGNYDEILMNYEISLENKILLNELDVVAINNEKLFIFECKSGGLNQEDLNKLKAIKDTLGKYSNIYLITYYKIADNNSNEKVLRQKLKDYNIKNYSYFNQTFLIDNNSKNTNI